VEQKDINKNYYPAFKNKNVGIILASSAYYAPYMAITIQSIITQATVGNNYDIIVLNREISIEDKDKIAQLAAQSTNVNIRYIDIASKLADLHYNYREGYAPESFYRVLLPYLLSHYDKVLYLDSDVIVLKDVAELYQTDIEGFLAGAVRDPDGIKCYFQNYHNRQLYMDQVLQLSDPTDYFQSGVMLMNLAEFRKQYTLEELVKRACDPEIIWGDQDVLNILCRGRVKYLDPSWNTIVDGYGGRVRDVREWAPDWIYEGYMEARKEPKIVHYAGVQPWKDPKVDMNGFFWPIAAQSAYYETIRQRIHEYKNTPQVKTFSVSGYPYIISVIIPVYNAEEYLRETIESVIAQTIDFEKNIQLILVNNATTDGCEEICLEYQEKYKSNVVYIKLEKNAGPIGARFAGLQKAQGKYINFLDSDDKWEPAAFERAFPYFENHYFEIDLLACRIYRFGAFEKWDVNDDKFRSTRIINVDDEYDALLQSMCSVIFKASFVKAIPWNYNITHAEDGAFLTSAIMRRRNYGVCRESVFCYRKRNNKTSLIDTRAEDKNWYLETTEKGYLRLIEECMNSYGNVPLYVQGLLIEEMVSRIRTPISSILNPDEKEKYIEMIAEVVSNISDFVIWEKKRLNKEEKLFLCYLKYGNAVWDKAVITRGRLYLNNIEIYRFAWKSSVMIETMEQSGTSLRLRGKINIPLPTEQYSIYVRTNRGKKYDLELTDSISAADERQYLDQRFMSPRYFDVSVSLEQTQKIEFKIMTCRQTYRLGFYMDKFARCASEYGTAYRLMGDYIIKPQGEELLLFNADSKTHLKKEIHFCRELYKKRKRKAIIWRIIVYILRMLGLYKNVWLVTDRKVSAGDSGEVFFKYAVEHCEPNVKIYFVISKSSPDYIRMKKIGKVVEVGSKKHKLLFLMAQKIVSSLTNDWTYDLMPYHKKELYDLLQFDFIHIQHGVIKDDISSSINLFNKNIRLFVTSGKREYESLLQYPYGYSPREVVLTGLPRFDAIQDCFSAKKGNVILIAPTWRKYLRGAYEPDKDLFGYNEEFKTSVYYHFYNDLINDPQLIECAKRWGYTLKFRLHPVMDGQAKDFIHNPYVQIEDQRKDYHQEMQETALVITDYSSIAFDYAYLYTPIIYAQFDKVEFEANHSYTNGYFDYERDGFGPVCYDYESAVRTIIEAIENGCVMTEAYHRRAEEFFAYRDGKNCERIYQELLKLDGGKRLKSHSRGAESSDAMPASEAGNNCD